MHRNGRDFIERDRSVLILLRPHIRQALAGAQLMTRLEAKNSALQSVVTDSSMSVLMLTPKNQILWGMPQALEILKQVHGWNANRPDQLPPVILDWVEIQDGQFGSPDQLPTPLSPLELECGSLRVRMRLLGKDSDRTIVIEETAAEISAEHLVSLGLTKRESEVLAWVGQGKTNDEIGHILGCSSRTVQKHLERIYIKLGVENRTAAAMVAVDTARAHRHSLTLDS